MIYEYREDGSLTVIGQLEVASPPRAQAAVGVQRPIRLIALFLDDAFLVLLCQFVVLGGTLGPIEVYSP